VKAERVIAIRKLAGKVHEAASPPGTPSAVIQKTGLVQKKADSGAHGRTSPSPRDESRSVMT